MRGRTTSIIAVSIAAGLLSAPAAARPTAGNGQELLVTASEPGARGGRLVVSLRTEPKTFNPLTAVDSASRDVVALTTANLVRIDRDTQRTTAALAKSWSVSADGLRYTLTLRRGLLFSDGHPVDADDVVFSVKAYQDVRTGSPQRDLLIIDGRPIDVRKLDPRTVVFELRRPYAAGERLFDGIAILPRHRLERAFEDGRLAQMWGVNTPPQEFSGLGPFRLKSYEPGQRVVLERNPHYWKADRAGNRLPYLDEIVFLLVPNEDAQVLRFRAGDTDAIVRLSADSYAALARRSDARDQLRDVGAGLDYIFLFFNLNDDVPARGLKAIARKQSWFREAAFRQAVSAALDREGMARLVFHGRATPLATHVGPGNKLWFDASLAAPRRSPERARELLKRAGFSWRPDGALQDSAGEAVEFSILTSSANPARVRLAAMAQDDLRAIGLRAQLVSLEQRALLDRVLQSHDYEAALLALGGGDADPNADMNVLLIDGPTHFWNMRPGTRLPEWEREIDSLMRQQLVTVSAAERKRLFDRVQRLIAENLPFISLVGPNVLMAARERLAGLRPGVLEQPLLWNADEIYWRPAPVSR